MSPHRNTRGFAMITALLFIAVLSILTGLVALFTLNNAKHTRSNIRISQTLAVAQGARNFGAALLGGPIRNELGSEITTEALAGTLGQNGTWVFDKNNTSQTATSPDPNAVITNLQNLAAQLQGRLLNGGCYGPYTLSSGEALKVRISFTGTMPLCDGSGGTTTVKLGYGRFLSGARSAAQTYSLPYVMIVSGKEGSADRTLTLTGQYNFTVGNGSFARYALFTDSEQVIDNSGSSGQNFFTGSYLFNGPVHTNGNFAFYGDPYKSSEYGSGQATFLGQVGSAGQNDAGTPGAWFMPSSGGSTSFISATTLASGASYKGTAPTFQGAVDWQAKDIPMPTNGQNQLNAAKNGGLYINGDTSSVRLYAGDASGNQLVQSSTGSWQPSAGANAAVYQYIQVCTSSSKCTLYREDSNKVLYELKNNGWTQDETGFNGVIYVNGNVQSFGGPDRPTGATDASTTPPAVASFAQLDMVTSNDLRITHDLTYQDPVCNGTLHRDSTGAVKQPTCTSDPAAVTNVLGIYASGDAGSRAMCSFPSYETAASQGGNICFGYQGVGNSLTAPQNLQVDATMMAANHVDMENWDTANKMGTLDIMGGVIAKYDGVYGVFSPGNGQSNGVLPRFTYDPRFDNGMSPPYFPTLTFAQLDPTTIAPIIYSQTEQTAF
jgi:hypothetical protein